jgi:DNA replication and repair protein RecF
MRVERVSLRDFRSYSGAELQLGNGLTIVHGPNGSGKTNLLEALYFGCTGRSFRTTNERELIHFGRSTARVVVEGDDDDGRHVLAVGFEPGQTKHISLDGAVVERLSDAPHRPLVSVFSPDRLELVKGPPALRRAHVDQFVAALWPARAATRRRYSATLAQRNALIARIRAGRAEPAALRPWDLELSQIGIELMADRRRAVALVVEPFAQHAAALGLEGDAQVRYASRSHADDPEGLADELAAALAADLARGHTTHGPHRDELALRRGGRNLRAYGSQGEQRIALLALLLAERDALAAERDRPPLMLLDDVMSELDAARREHLAHELLAGGQVVVTTTELDSVPCWDDAAVMHVEVTGLAAGTQAPVVR